MAVAKTLEIISSSTESIEAVVRDNKVAEWRVTLRITFIVS